MIPPYRPRLLIQVVWHPGFARGRELAGRVHRHFARDPDQPGARGLGIPVRFRSEPAEGGRPLPIVLDDAHHTIVVVLVDAKMLLDRAAWAWLRPLWETASAPPVRHRVFHVSLTPNSYQVLPETNHIRLHSEPAEAQPGLLLNRLTNEAARLLTHRPTVQQVEARDIDDAASPPRLRLFLSHAKRDGEAAASSLRDYIHARLALNTFFDAIDIDAGTRWDEALYRNIDTGALAILHTDAYASRVWCQHEILRAKLRGRPVVVIEALEDGEARAFPYLGNVPTIRWRPNDPARLEAIVGLILREVLRSEHFVRHFADLAALFDLPAGVRALPRAPELLTALGLRGEAATVPFFVYPDPPLAAQELGIVHELAPGLRLTTPTALLANPPREQPARSEPDDKSLRGWRLGLSISDSADLARRGLGFPRLPEDRGPVVQPHLRDAMTEFARYLLAAGASLAYGGDLRQDGFTLALFELLSAYRSDSGEETPPVQSWLAWPIHLDLSEDQEAAWVGQVEFHPVPAPANLGLDPSAKPGANTPETAVAWARSLTAMRLAMNAAIDARLLLGGQIGSLGANGRGRYPGLAEEALFALRSRKPVYLVGAFGGCANAVIAALRGEQPAAFTEAARLSTPELRAARDRFNGQLGPGEEAIDYAALTAEFEQFGVAGLNNGLDDAENARLFETTHLPEMIALVLRGLVRLRKSSGGGG